MNDKDTLYLDLMQLWIAAQENGYDTLAIKVNCETQEVDISMLRMEVSDDLREPSSADLDKLEEESHEW